MNCLELGKMKNLQRMFIHTMCGCILLQMQPIQSMAIYRPDHVSEDDANSTCGHKSLPYYKVDEHFCCFCPAGTYKYEDCKFEDPETTVCKPCPFDSVNPDGQTYMDEQNHATECKPALGATYCERIMNSRRVNGEVYANAKCVCKDGFLPHRDSIDYGCFPHSPCSPGFHPTHLGNSSHDTICGRCPSGTFSNTLSPMDQCIKFSSCSGGVILQPGDSKHDVVCNRTRFMPTVPSTVTSTAEIETTPLPPPTHPEQQTDLSHLHYTIIGLSIAMSIAIAILASILFWVLWSGYQCAPSNDPTNDNRNGQDPRVKESSEQPGGASRVAQAPDEVGDEPPHSHNPVNTSKNPSNNADLPANAPPDAPPNDLLSDEVNGQDQQVNAQAPDEVDGGDEPPHSPDLGPEEGDSLIKNKDEGQIDSPKQVTPSGNPREQTPVPSCSKEGGDERMEMGIIDEPGQKDLTDQARLLADSSATSTV